MSGFGHMSRSVLLKVITYLFFSSDVYIVLQAIKSMRGYTEQKFLTAMREVVVPVSMTSMYVVLVVLFIKNVIALFLSLT